MNDDGKLSIISRKEARKLLDDPAYRHAIFGNHCEDPDFVEWEAEWLTRIAGGYTPCDCADRHKGACSSRGAAINNRWKPSGQDRLI